MRFAFVEEHSKLVPVERLCRMLKVTSRGFRAWRGRPICQRQRYDMVLLANVWEQMVGGTGIEPVTPTMSR